MLTYHFHDVERLPNQHLSDRESSALGESSASILMHTVSRTCAMPPAVPAVRSLTVFDMAERVLCLTRSSGGGRGWPFGLELVESAFTTAETTASFALGHTEDAPLANQKACAQTFCSR